MPILSYSQLEDGFTASANIFNQRFGVIHDLLNGNLDSANLANSAVTREKIAPGAVTSDKILTTRYIDDNGWTVLDLGGHKTYTKDVAVNAVPLNQGERHLAQTTLPPVGRTRDNISILTAWYGGYAGHAIVGVEPSSVETVNSIDVYHAHNWPSPLTFTGSIAVTVTDKI